MIFLQAIPLDICGERFRFLVDAFNNPPRLASSDEEAVQILSNLGVSEPGRFIAHVKVWGFVEIQLDAIGTASGE